LVFFFSSRRRHTSFSRDWSSDVCSSDLFEGTIEVATNSDGPHQVWIEAVANQWKNNLGVDSAPKLYPTFAAFLDEREADVVGGQIGRASCRERLWMVVTAVTARTEMPER